MDWIKHPPESKLNYYLVGGAVRDQILFGSDSTATSASISISDKDFVVIGETPESMIKLGFKPVGKDFPVFLHPITQEEYALARTEKKIAKGHQGFSFSTDPNITLEQDLIRRDLTINSMAKDLKTQQIIDPYNGQLDLKNRILRHTSPAFSEDPLRVLRLARFYARFKHLNFTIAPETIEIIKHLINQKILTELSSERIWQETHKALNTQTPSIYFECLINWGAFGQIYPDYNPNNLNLDLNLFKTFQNTILNPIEKYSVLFINSEQKLLKIIPKKYLNFHKKLYFINYFLKQMINKNFKINPDFILNLFLKTDALRQTNLFLNAIKLIKNIYPEQLLAIQLLNKILIQLKSEKFKPDFKNTTTPIPEQVKAWRLSIIQKIILD